MKLQIRQGVFETNSSSMHSIVVKKTIDYYTKEEAEEEIYVRKSGKWAIHDYELQFGRSPFEIIGSFERKIHYAIASWCGNYLDKNEIENKFQEIEQIVKKYIPETKLIELPERYNYSFGEEEKYYGYVDHESIGLLQDFLEEKEITLEEFLTNKRYIVIIDGDEYCLWKEAKKTGIIDLNEIEEEFE